MVTRHPQNVINKLTSRPPQREPGDLRQFGDVAACRFDYNMQTSSLEVTTDVEAEAAIKASWAAVSYESHAESGGMSAAVSKTIVRR